MKDEQPAEQETIAPPREAEPQPCRQPSEGPSAPPLGTVPDSPWTTSWHRPPDRRRCFGGPPVDGVPWETRRDVSQEVACPLWQAVPREDVVGARPRPCRVEGDRQAIPWEQDPSLPPAGNRALLRILVVDDHALVRDGLKRLLEDTVNGCAVKGASGGFHGLNLLRKGAFDLAIVDLSMPDMDGLQFVNRARAEHPALRLLILSLHAEEQYALRGFKAGANGYLTKECSPDELISAVHKVIGGGEFVSTTLAERMVRGMSPQWDPPRLSRLSDRELEVLCRLVSGQRIADIADSLHISAKTVSTHKSRILERLQLPNLAALIRYGIEEGLLPPKALPGRP
jgi:two-component system invasion response regulator UvrY